MIIDDQEINSESKTWDDISIGIVMHNASGHIRRTIEAALASGCPAQRLIVADVSSEDDSRTVVKNIDSRIRIEQLSENNGPNPARNRLMSACRTGYLLLMDSDVIIDTHAVKQLSLGMDEHEGCGIASPLVVHDDQPDIVQYGGSWMHYICESVNRCEGKSLSDRGDEPAVIGVASGNALLLNLELLSTVGGFDEDMFMGKEDGDFTYRVRVAGLKIVEIPSAVVRHASGPRGTTLYYYQLRNRWVFLLKNYERRTLFLIAPVLIGHEILQFGLMVYSGQIRTYFAAWKGFLSEFRQTVQKRADVARTRKTHDSSLLVAESFVLRKGLIKNRFLLKIKVAYEQLLRLYWYMASSILRRV